MQGQGGTVSRFDSKHHLWGLEPIVRPTKVEYRLEPEIKNYLKTF